MLQVVTSMTLDALEELLILGSTTLPQDGSPSKFCLSVPLIRSRFTGTGDLMTALLLAHVSGTPEKVASAVERAVASVQSVLMDTKSWASTFTCDGSADTIKAHELRLVQNQQAIIKPVVSCVARALS
jgi:pyridoxine kinase